MDLFTCKKGLFMVLFIIVGEIQHYISTQTFRNRQFLNPYVVLHDDALSLFVAHTIQKKIQLLCCL